MVHSQLSRPLSAVVRAAFVLGLASVASVATYADVVLHVDSQSVNATGATPGGQVLLIGISHEEENYSGAIIRDDGLLTADASGAVSWPRPEGVSSRSLWFAVDVESGTVAAGSPDGFPLRQVEAPSSVVSRKELFDAMETPFFYAEMFLIRPRRGVWTLAASRGGTRDLKLKRGVLSVDPRTFVRAAGTDSPPGTVKHGDILIVADPYALAFYTVRWEK